MPPRVTQQRNQQLALACGEAVRRLRQKIGVSQEDLASKAGIDRSFMSQIERGVRQPTLTTLFKLSRALTVEPDELVKHIRETYGTAGP